MEKGHRLGVAGASQGFRGAVPRPINEKCSTFRATGGPRFILLDFRGREGLPFSLPVLLPLPSSGVGRDSLPKHSEETEEEKD